MSTLPIVEKYCQEVADYFGVTVPWMMSKRSTRVRVQCRSLAIALIHKHSRLTLTEIGEQFLMDHTTVINNLKRAKKFDEYRHFLGEDDVVDDDKPSNIVTLANGPWR